jgi:hypothetical protein
MAERSFLTQAKPALEPGCFFKWALLDRKLSTGWDTDRKKDKYKDKRIRGKKTLFSFL